MGYTTDFSGTLKPDKKIPMWLFNYINAFSEARHVQVNVEKFKAKYPDWQERCYRGDVGKEGAFLVIPWEVHQPRDPNEWKATHDYLNAIYNGQKPKEIPLLMDGNRQPEGVPGLWCQWIFSPAEDAPKDAEEIDAELEWDGGEKFYNYVEWLKFLIENFIAPADISLSGVIVAAGEDRNDRKYIVVADNRVQVYGYEQDIEGIANAKYADYPDVQKAMIEAIGTMAQYLVEDDEYEEDE